MRLLSYILVRPPPGLRGASMVVSSECRIYCNTCPPITEMGQCAAGDLLRLRLNKLENLSTSCEDRSCRQVQVDIMEDQSGQSGDDLWCRIYPKSDMNKLDPYVQATIPGSVPRDFIIVLPYAEYLESLAFIFPTVVSADIYCRIPQYKIPTAQYIVVKSSKNIGISPKELHLRLINCFIFTNDSRILILRRESESIPCTLEKKLNSKCFSTEEIPCYSISQQTQICICPDDDKSRRISKTDASLSFRMVESSVSELVRGLLFRHFVPISNPSKPEPAPTPVFPTHSTRSLLITGESGSGKTALVYGTVDFLNATIGQETNVDAVEFKRTVHIEVITAGVIYAHGREYADRYLRETIASVVIRSHVQPVLILFDDIDALVPQRQKYNSHTFSTTEDQVVQVMADLFQHLKTSDSTSFNIFIVGIARNETSVNSRVLSCFGESCCIKSPTSIVRKRALEVLTSHVRDSIISDRGGMVCSETQNSQIFPPEMISELLESGIGLQLGCLSFLWSRIMVDYADKYLQHMLMRIDPEGEIDKTIIDEVDTLDIKSISLQEKGMPDLPIVSLPQKQQKVSAKLNLENVCGLESVKTTVRETLIWPRLYPEIFKKFGLRNSTGILLYGPPGTGKTLLAREIAEELNGKFIVLKLSDILRGHIGVGERIVRGIFADAKSNSPSVLFIDEFQALFSSRQNTSDEGGGGHGGDSVGASLSAALAQCLDEVVSWNRYAGSTSLITVIAATNEPWAIDTGFLRAGRFDKSIFVGPIESSGRFAILRREFSLYSITNTVETIDDPHNFDNDYHLKILSEHMPDTFSGADVCLYSQQIKKTHFNDPANKEMIQDKCDGSIDKLDIDIKLFYDTLKTFPTSISVSELRLYHKWGTRKILG